MPARADSSRILKPDTAYHGDISEKSAPNAPGCIFPSLPEPPLRLVEIYHLLFIFNRFAIAGPFCGKNMTSDWGVG
jgi:hypothetical protein